MSQQAFFFDGTRCSGCKTCMFACKDAYDLDVGTAYRRVLEYTGGDTVRNGDGTFGSTCFSYNVSVACNHCDDPVCVEACPARALDFGPVGDMEKLGERADIAPFPRPEATVPNLFVKPSADARPAESKDGVVANLLEVGFRATDKEIME